MSRYSLEFPNKKESAARHLKYGFFAKQRNLVKISKRTEWSLSHWPLGRAKLRQPGPFYFED